MLCFDSLGMFSADQLGLHCSKKHGTSDICVSKHYQIVEHRIWGRTMRGERGSIISVASYLCHRYSTPLGTLYSVKFRSIRSNENRWCFGSLYVIWRGKGYCQSIERRGLRAPCGLQEPSCNIEGHQRWIHHDWCNGATAAYSALLYWGLYMATQHCIGGLAMPTVLYCGLDMSTILYTRRRIDAHNTVLVG